MENLILNDFMIRLLYIDLFCGAGGTSTGVEDARYAGEECAKVIACVNHDANAIASHMANHPEALHFTEDIRTMDLSPLVAHVRDMKEIYPGSLVVLWASLECTNFSKAKGGQPRDADSRTLAEHLFRYIEALNPDYIQIENVEEFMCWGELDENGHPVSRYKGTSYLRWVKNVCAYGYNFDFRLLNAADYGAYTSRKRFFCQFARHGLPIAFPKATHAKQIHETSSEHSLFPEEDSLEQWKPVREVLDLDDEGKSIFGRKKPLVEKTLERIYAGLIKFVAGGKEEFLMRYNTVRPQDTVKSLEEPCGVLTCDNRFAKAKVHFLSKQFGGAPSGKNISIEEPAETVTCRDHHAFISVHYGNGYNSPIDMPAPTVTCKDRFGLVTCKFLTNEYSGGGQLSAIEHPCPALLTIPKQKLVSVKTMELGKLSNSIDGLPDFIRLTDKGIVYEIYDTDSEIMKKIKEFMALYVIVDITMLMLNISELKRIMGFPEGYVLLGTRAEQKKFIGNAVEVNMARVLCEALCKTLSKNKLKKAI